MLFRPTGKARNATIRHFLLLYLPTAVLLTSVFLLTAYYHQSVLKNAISLKERDLTALARNSLEADMKTQVSDAAFLSALTSMHLEESERDPSVTEKIVKELSRFAETNGAYLVIRYLNTDGQEIFRLIVTPEGIKRASSEDAGGGSSQISPKEHVAEPNEPALRLELVAGENTAGKPATPIIRFFTPVRGENDVALGQLILDYNGTQLLDDLRREADRSYGSVWLLDSRGRWLLGPDPDKEWGVMSGASQSQTISESIPEAWKQMAGKDMGQFFTKHGLFTFKTVRLQDGHASGMNWTIVTFVKAEAFVPEWLHSAIGLHAALLTFLAVVIWFWANAKTKRAAAEQVLRRSERKLRAITESALAAVIMIDGRDLVQYWNPAAERMFGYTAEDILGQKCHEYLALDENRNEVEKGMVAFAHTGKGRIVGKIRELTGRRKDGSTFPLELAVSPVWLDGEWGAVGSIRDITQRKLYEKRLWELATTDDLTGAVNRRQFMNAAAKELEKAKRYQDEASFIMLDVDKFKDINDAHGHDAGDAVLRGLAEVCRKNLREVDIFGRIGGEEFAVFLPRIGLAGAERAAERLRAAMEATAVTVKGPSLGVTISLGVTTLNKEADTLEDLYKRADIALYAAKMGGRNRLETA